MKFLKITESSPNTFSGSMTDDLIKSKLWICQTLKKLDLVDFASIYVLGSWYGNTAIILKNCGINFQKIINVDIDKTALSKSNQILSYLGINAKHMHRDANKLSYHQLPVNSLVINTSVNDMSGVEWFKKIPKGTLVVLQSRNNVKNTQHTDISHLDKQFPMTKTMYLKQKTLHDPETEYQRFMKIGII